MWLTRYKVNKPGNAAPTAIIKGELQNTIVSMLQAWRLGLARFQIGSLRVHNIIAITQLRLDQL